VSETPNHEVLARKLDELCEDAMLDGCMENASDLGYEYGTPGFWFEVFCQMEGLVNL
jgi:hypothetical protein